MKGLFFNRKRDKQMLACKFKLGDIARDSITGFSGVIIGIHHWLNGCTTITIKSREMKDGKPLDSVAFDEPQVELVEEKDHKSEPNRGGPHGDPTTPSR